MVDRPGWWLVAVVSVPLLVSFAAGCGDDRRASPPARATAVDAGDAAGSVTDAAPPERGPTCADKIKNGAETDVDCGGGTCGRCGLGKRCEGPGDCLRGVCNASGICVECLTAADCPGAGTACNLPTCVGGACGFEWVAARTALATQVPGDCLIRRCDGAGGVVDTIDDTDIPEDDNPCTQDTCSSGVPGHLPVAERASCGSERLCDGEGHCVGCLEPTDCPGTDGPCQTRTCSKSGICGAANAPSGAAPEQTAGDCQVLRCDGSGHAVQAVDDTDVPVDGDPCTDDVCAGGVPSNPPLEGTDASCPASL